MSRVFLSNCTECGMTTVLNIDTLKWVHAAGGIDDHHEAVVDKDALSKDVRMDIIDVRLAILEAQFEVLREMAQRRHIRHERSISRNEGFEWKG